MNHPQSSNTFSLPGWVAAIAFAAVVGSFFLVFFTVRVGDVEPAAIKGIDLVLGIGQAAVDVAPLGTVVLDQVTVADTSTTDPASSGSVADKARQLLKEHEKTRSEAPVPAVRRPSPEKTRAPMAIAVLACAVLGLVASLIPQRASRFAAATCAIVGLICAAVLMTGAKDLPLAQATGGTLVVTGALEVVPGIGFWAAIGGLAMATLLAALGMVSFTRASTPLPALEKVSHTRPTAVAATPAMRTYSSSEKKEKARAPEAPAPVPLPPAVVTIAPAPAPAPPTAPEIPSVPMVPEEPPKGPDTPPVPPTPPSSGSWSFKQPEPTPPPPPAPPQAPAPQPPSQQPSSWSFGGGDQTAPRQTPTQQPPPSVPPPQKQPSTWSFGGADRPTPPPAPPPPPPRQPPPPSQPPPGSFHTPPPPPPHKDNPMENQGPSYPPPPSASMNIFTGFAAPYFNLIDSGALYRRPFVILYMVFAGLNLLSILGVLGFMFKGGIALIITGLFTIFALWVGFQLWWNRREKVNAFVTPGSEFVALPVFSHLWQTIGEWMGTFIAIAGTGASLGGLIGSIGSSERGSYGDPMAVFSQLGFAGLIACPLGGFIILILSRAIAEQIRALVAVANNTKNIDNNTRRS